MTDEDRIRGTIQTYFDSMHESSAEKAKTAFHPDARITGYLDGDVHEITAGEFAERVAGRQPSPKATGVPARLEILSIHIAGKTAVARVRDEYLGITFLDTLSLLESDGQWRIYTKLFHVEADASQPARRSANGEH